MKTKTAGLILALCFVGIAVCFGDDPQMGTWKLNEAKSKFAPGAPKNHTVVYGSTGDNVKVTVDGTDKDGKATHNEWTGKFDGKDYAVTGDPTSDMRSYKKIGDRVVKITVKKDGKVTVTGRIVVSADGKSRIVTTGEAGAEGKSPKNRAIYDKQ
jgi:glucose/arabinose dehydrogenase